MDQLSSCYFCGTALDESLGTYRLGSSGGHVRLCQGCHEKLETVFEAANVGPDALADEPAALDGETASGSATDAETAEQQDEPDSTGESEGEQTDQPDTDESSGSEPQVIVETNAEETDGEETAEEEWVSKGGSGGEAADAAEDDAAEGEDNGMDDDPAPEETDAEDILVDLEAEEPTDADPSEPADADGDDVADGDGPIYLEEDDIIVAETDPDAADPSEQPEDGESTGDDSRDGNSTDASAETGERESTDGPDIDQSLTKLEYNKVMRLLQNREFPVDREKFVIVAANAYGLARSECNAVIDLAIDRGFIAEDEEEGQLLRAD